MAKIRDFNTLLGHLDRGGVVAQASQVLAETLVELQQQSDEAPKKNIKGKVTLTLEISIQNGLVSINGEVAAKTPKVVRPSSIYWVTADGELTTEHPQQIDMFKPRDVAAAS